MTIERGEALRQLCDEFIKGRVPRYIFGRTPYAKDIIEYIKPDGIIDDFTTESTFNGVPIIKLASVPAKAIVVSSIVDGRPVTVSRLLAGKEIGNIDYYSFKHYSGLPLKEHSLVANAEFRSDYQQNRDKYDYVFNHLADETSKETFSRLVDFRLNEHLETMEYFTFRPEESYFESFINIDSTNAVFADVGSYDGSTTLEFIRRYPGYRSVHLFEPEPKQMAVIRSRVEALDHIHFHEYGASNCAGVLKFTSSGSWSHVDEQGDIEVKINTLDNLVNEKISFIKMDIEGHEYAALEGSREHILNDHPVLAICAYHLVDDFWKLPELIFSFRSDYKLYMRHYTEGVLETVYYFIPEKHNG
ncbi:FkbM family methyltransferase [Yokenella regensburgei]|uniref:FkbM family methyltransferase n=1 Tax=Yokenella regensburgei TaxID=158877 RepID=UPI003F181A29